MRNNDKKIKYLQNKINFFLSGIRRFWLIILVLCVAGGAAGGVISRAMYTPEYTAVQAFSIEIEDHPEAGIATVSENQLSKTIPSLMSSQTFMDYMEPYLRENKLSGKFMVNSLSNTNIFYLTVVSRSNENCLKITEQIQEHYPDILSSVIGDCKLHYFTEPTTSNLPSNSPNYTAGIAVGALVMVVLSIGVLLAVTFLTKTITTPSEAEEALNSTCLAVIDEVKFKRRSKDKKKEFDMLLITDESADITLKQSINKLATKLSVKCEKDGYKVILFSSTISGEGKTSTSVNTAINLTLIGKKVLIMDCDLRSPSVCKKLGMDDLGTSLTETIEGWLPVKDAIHGTNIDNLDILGNCESDKNAAANASSNDLKNTINSLRDKYDYIIIDSPPIGFLGDGINIADIADAFVYIISHNYISSGYAMRSLEAFNDSDAEMLGFVINHKH